MMRKHSFLEVCCSIICLSSFFSFNSFKSVSAATGDISARDIVTTDMSDSQIRSYYSSVNGKSGRDLLTSLHEVLKNHTTYSYDQIWNAYKITDRDWTQSPLTESQKKGYDFSDDPYVKVLYRTDNFTSTAAKSSCHDNTQAWNFDREHIWPKSLGNFDTNKPAGTDLHHLLPGDKRNNSQGHNNYAWGNAIGITEPNVGYEDKNNLSGKLTTRTQGGVSYNVYEPQDCDKGDIARACFYMAARYSVYTSATDPYLELTDDLSLIESFTATTTKPGNCGLLSDLLEWNRLDPVDDFERHRNNLVYYNFQHNRNPFIDFPEWADIAFGKSTNKANPVSDLIGTFGDKDTDIAAFENTQTYGNLCSEYTKIEVENPGTQYELITDYNDLHPGEIYTISSSYEDGSSVVMSTEKSDNNRKGTNVTISNETFEANDSILKLKLGGNASTGYTFTTINYLGTNGYLSATSTTSSNFLKVQNSLDNYGKFSIEFSENESVIKCLGKSTNNQLMKNSSSALFSCYSSTQKPIYLFKLIVPSYYPAKTDGKYNISLGFGTCIPASLKSALDNKGITEYGIAYKKAGVDAFSYVKNDGCYTLNTMASESINESLNDAISNNHYYQFALRINHIPEENWSTEITACGYIKQGSVYYYTISKTYSVVSIAKEYIKNHASNPGVIAHIDMLTWLAGRE